MRGNAICGHTEWDRGHCHEPGCPNHIDLCKQCQSWTKGFPEKDTAS